MAKYITFGNWNKNYLFLLAEAVFFFIYSFISGFNYYTYEIGLFPDNNTGGHIYIHKFFYYLILLVSSAIFLLYKKKIDKKNQLIEVQQNDDNIYISRNSNLIFVDMYSYVNTKISKIFAILIIFLYVFFEFVDLICVQYFCYCDFWMMELIVMTYLNNKMFKLKIYKHHLISIYLIAIPFLLKVATIVLLYYDENNYLKDDQINYRYSDKTFYLKSLVVAHWWLLPIAIITYFIIMTINSYLIITIKKIIDIKYTSISIILVFYGGFGTLLTFIFSLIATFKSCGKRKEEEVYDLYDYLCFITDNDGERFIENFKVYFSGNLGKDLLYSLSGAIAYAAYSLFLFKIVQHLNPIYKSFSFPVFYFLEKIILLYKVNDNQPLKYVNESFFLDLSSDAAAIIIFLIYLEIIELNFCDLNKNLRKYIITRSKNDFDKYNNDNKSDRESSIFTEENDDETDELN